MRVSVIGGGTVSAHHRQLAKDVGVELGRRGHDIVCGGLDGVMRAVAQGTSSVGGRSIGILPGRDPAEANEHLDVVITTGLGNMRNVLVVENGDGVIAIGGAYGTLSEIALALDVGRPVVGLDTHEVDGVHAVDDPTTAVEALERIVEDDQ